MYAWRKAAAQLPAAGISATYQEYELVRWHNDMGGKICRPLYMVGRKQKHMQWIFQRCS